MMAAVCAIKYQFSLKVNTNCKPHTRICNASEKKWITPQGLLPGDRVGVVAPAGPVNREELESGLHVIVKMGFKPVTGSHVLARKGFLAGSDAARAEDFMTMIEDPSIRAIFCARGGYGVNRILPLLDPRLIRKHPKIVVGSSDITLLLSYLNQHCDLVAYHGPMVSASFGCRPMSRSRKQFRNFLQGVRTQTPFTLRKAVRSIWGLPQGVLLAAT